jgi:hypothetical protein
VTTVHVTPVDDLVEHEQSEDCVCGPTVEMVEGGWLVVHESLDRREDRE